MTAFSPILGTPVSDGRVLDGGDTTSTRPLATSAKSEQSVSARLNDVGGRTFVEQVELP